MKDETILIISHIPFFMGIVCFFIAVLSKSTTIAVLIIGILLVFVSDRIKFLILLKHLNKKFKEIDRKIKKLEGK